MFCHSCGAKNVDGSRFCNMCGGKLSAPPASLDQTQLGVGTSPELERVIAETRRSSIPSSPSLPSSASSPGTTQRSARPAAVDPTATTERARASNPPAAPPSTWASTSQSMKAAEVPVGFDPSLSVQLDAIGIRSPRRLWVTVGIGAAVLLALGGVTSFLATREEPSAGHAQAGDPFEIGAPTAEVDFVSGSNGRPSATPTPTGQEPVAEAARPRGEPPMNLTTNGTPTAPSSSSPAPSTGMGSTAAPRISLLGPSIPIDPTPIPLPPRTTAPSTTTPSTTAPSTTTPSTTTPSTTVAPPPASQDTTTAAETTPEMDAEMYAARVRYLVRRYYASRAQSCFSAATARNETVSGQVVIGMHIGADGHVTSARVSRNTTGDDALGACLADQASSWELAPPPGGSADLSFPFSR